MATKDTVVQELVVNTLTHKQFKAAQEAGTLTPYELYGTPDTSVRLPVLTPMWFDHITNDVSWLRADTFSWQSGDMYKAAYEHLADDYENAEDTTQLYYLDLRSTDKVYEDGSAVTISGYTKSIAVGEKVFGRDEGIATITSIGDIDIIDDTMSNVYDLVLTFDTGVVVTFQGIYDSKTVTSSVDEIDDLFIFYRLTKDGHKICLPDQESKISALYEATGAADYYLLDTANKQFKLPRKHKRTLIQAVNNTDGTWYNLYSDGWVEQGGKLSGRETTFPIEFSIVPTLVFGVYSGASTNTPQNVYSEITTTGFTGWRTRVNAGWDSGAEDWNGYWQASGYAAESAYASAGMRLEYYYVGNFEQDAVEQTAGINAEMFNSKADIDLGNIPANYDYVVESQLPAADNGYTWYRKYKSGWVEQGGVSSVGPSTSDTITLPIEMFDTNYTLMSGLKRTTNSGSGHSSVGGTAVSTTQIKLIGDYNDSGTGSMQGAYWQVSGQAA